MDSRKIRGRIMEWRCCGHIWQLIISPRYPGRDGWAPECPDCGEKGLTWREVGRKSRLAEMSKVIGVVTES